MTSFSTLYRVVTNDPRNTFAPGASRSKCFSTLYRVVTNDPEFVEHLPQGLRLVSVPSIGS